MQAALAKLAKAGYKAKTVIVSCGKVQDSVIVVQDPFIGVKGIKEYSNIYMCPDKVDRFLQLRGK